LHFSPPIEPPMSITGIAISDETSLQPLLLDEFVAKNPPLDVKQQFRANLQREIDAVTGRIDCREVGEVAYNILSKLVSIFALLARIEENLHKLDALLESLSLLEVLQFEAHSLLDYIETKAM